MSTNPDSDHGTTYYRVEDQTGLTECYPTLKEAMMDAAFIYETHVFLDNKSVGVCVTQMERDTKRQGDRELLCVWCNGEYTREARIRGLDIPYLYPQRTFRLPSKDVFHQDCPTARVRVWVEGPELDKKGTAENPPRQEYWEFTDSFAGRLDAFNDAMELVHKTIATDGEPERGVNHNADANKWTVALSVEHPLGMDDTVDLDLGTIIRDKMTGRVCVINPGPVLDWFVLDLSTGRTWLTDYAPGDLEHLDEAAVASMNDQNQSRSQRRYIWINLSTGQMESRNITLPPPPEPDDRVDPDHGETDRPTSILGPP